MLLGFDGKQEQGEKYQELSKQACRILACAIVIRGLEALRDTKRLLEPVARVYGQSCASLSRQLKILIEQNLDKVSTTLFEWQSQAIVGQRKNEGKLPQRLAARATADYGLAAFDLARHLDEVERQKEICTKLPFWLRRLGRNSEALLLEDTLLALLVPSGNAKQIATTLFEQGTHLFYDRMYDTAASKLRQAIQIAEKCHDSELADKAKRALANTDYFLKRNP